MSTVTNPTLLRLGRAARKHWDRERRMHGVVYPLVVEDTRIAAWATSPAANAMVHTLSLQEVGCDVLATYMQVRRTGLTTRAKTTLARVSDYLRWYRAYPGDRKHFTPRRSVK